MDIAPVVSIKNMANMCKQCGNCCRHFKFRVNLETLTLDVAGRPVMSFDRDIEEFIRVRGSWGTIHRIEFRKSGECGMVELDLNEPCVYLEGNVCGIHGIKPKFCREWHCG